MSKKDFNYVFECAWDLNGSLYEHFVYSKDKAFVSRCYNVLMFDSPSLLYAQCKDIANGFVFLKYLR